MDIYTDINLRENYVDRAVIRNSKISNWNNADSPDPGSIKFSDNQLYYYSNGAWVPVGTGGGGGGTTYVDGYFTLAKGSNVNGTNWEATVNHTSGSGSQIKFDLENNDLTVYNNNNLSQKIQIPIYNHFKDSFKEYTTFNSILVGDFELLPVNYSYYNITIDVPDEYSQYLQVSLYREGVKGLVEPEPNGIWENIIFDGTTFLLSVDNNADTANKTKVNITINNYFEGIFHFIIIGSSHSNTLTSESIHIIPGGNVS